MRVSIIGTGYVGSVLGAGLAKLGHDVLLVDIIQAKVDLINQGKSPIYERGLQELNAENRERIKATTNIQEAILGTEITFICVGTPSRKDGSMSLAQVESACSGIASALARKQQKHYIVIKSTVLPGTSEHCIKLISDISGKKFPSDFSLAFNPEFLREGSAVHDFFNQDRIVIGTTDREIAEKVKELYKEIKAPILETKFGEAEMIKYTNNSFLATKISFINEIGNICKKLGIDSNVVARGIGMDFRIGPHFLKSGLGFGGSCFPKDVSAVVHKATEKGYNPRLLRAVLDVNREQPLKFMEILEKRAGNLQGKKIAVLGLTFKAGTDDVRESPSFQVLKELLLEQAEIYAYDPVALESVKKIFPYIHYSSSAQEAVASADITLILTEWPEFLKVDYGEKLVIDGKNLFDSENAARRPKNYEVICW